MITRVTTTPNNSKHTIILRGYNNGKLTNKYKIVFDNKKLFEEAVKNTPRDTTDFDWDHFLRTNKYYVIK